MRCFEPERPSFTRILYSHARVTSVGLLIPQDPTITFEYPHHIDRASLDALPARPGIYIFRDQQGIALYIGKSINIRARVLSHMRTPEEARMLLQSSYVEFERTAGEIGGAAAGVATDQTNATALQQKIAPYA